MAKAKKLKSGNWRVLQYDYTDTKGKRHYKSFTAPTRREAELKASDYAVNKTISNSYENLTLKESYIRYIDSKSAVISPSTLREYIRSSKNDFPQLMPMKLSKITPELVQTAVNEAAIKYSPKTIRNQHGLLHSVLKAYYPQLILNTRLPQKIKPNYIIPTTKEIQTLLNNADEKIRVPILLASNGGLRRSEICALTLEDVTDFGVNVNKAKVYDKNKKLVVKQPKTEAGYRVVPLPTEVIKEVKEWKYFDMHPSNLDHWFSDLVKVSDVPHISFHRLRHYFASELHAQGVPDKYIARIGGWESVEMLHQIYQHTLRDKEETFNSKVVDVFTSNFKCNTENKTASK